MNLESIQSEYIIKKYIKTEWINLLTSQSIESSIFTYQRNQLILPALTKSIITSLEEKFNTDDIKELDKLTVLANKHLDNLVNVKKLYNQIDCNVKRDILEKVYGNDFIPLTVIQWIELKALNCLEIKFENIKITILDEKTISETLVTHICKIIRWLLAINSTPQMDISIYIFLSPEKKHMEDSCLDSKTDNNHSCHLSRTNINSGASWGGNWIQIFRAEEILKVLIHELAHYLVLDIQTYSSKIDSYCSHLKMHKDSKEILVNEAYTELLAIYLHTMYITYCRSPNNIFDSELFWDLYLQEEKFTIYQINKIFTNYSIESLDYFSKSNNFIQHTNVISYFIIKYLFFINTKYIIMCWESKEQTIKLIKYLLQRFFKLKIPKVVIGLNSNTSLAMSFNSIF